METTTARKLVAFIRQHSVTAWQRGSRVWAIEYGTQRDANGTVRPYHRIVELTSRKAALAWLGY